MCVGHCKSLLVACWFEAKRESMQQKCLCASIAHHGSGREDACYSENDLCAVRWWSMLKPDGTAERSVACRARYTKLCLVLTLTCTRRCAGTSVTLSSAHWCSRSAKCSNIWTKKMIGWLLRCESGCVQLRMGRALQYANLTEEISAFLLFVLHDTLWKLSDIVVSIHTHSLQSCLQRKS